MKESYEFSDMNGDGTSTSRTQLAPGESHPGKGCHISTAMGFVLALLAILIAVGVGIIVHFAAPARKLECHCNYPTPGTGVSNPEAQWQACLQMAKHRDHCVTSGCPGGSSPPSTAITTTPTTPEAPQELPYMRLPTSIIPVHYELELEPRMYDGPPESFTFRGSVKILLECVQATSNITLHIKSLSLVNSSIRLTGDSGAAAPGILNYDLDLTREFVVFNLDADLTESSRYNLEMEFSGPLKDDLHGLYRSSYLENNRTVYLATSQFFSSAARKAFPCFDEPAIKATFDITLVRRNDYRGLSNMPVIRHEARGTDLTADIFNQTVKMSTYLLSFVVSKFVSKKSTSQRGFEVEVWARPDSISRAEYALNMSLQCMEFFEEYNGIDYPMPKIGSVAVPDYAFGAMENWGLILYRESSVLFDPTVSGSRVKSSVASIVAHELAHQWFGNLVTPAWWDDLWLNEGFASFADNVARNNIHPEWKVMETLLVRQIYPALALDGIKASHPIYVPVNHPDEVNEVLDRITYFKGSSILRMLYLYMGETKFQEGVNRYLSDHQYGAATHADLWDAMDASMDNGNEVSIKEMMSTWILQMNYPVVTVTRTRDHAFKVSQSRFLVQPDAIESQKYSSPYGYKWDIPFTYTTRLESDFDTPRRRVLRKEDGQQEISDNTGAVIPEWNNLNWVIGNVRQAGFYRVNYDNANWNALIRQLKNNHTVIATENRAQLINDAWNLAKAGLTPASIALGTTEYLSDEEELVPWRAAVLELTYVESMIARTGLYGDFKAFMMSLVMKQYRRLGWETKNNNLLESLTRSLLIEQACHYDLPDCVNEAKKLFSEWMRNENINRIPVEQKETVYCTAIAHGGRKEWDFAYRMFRESGVAEEQLLLQGALACSRETWILSRYLSRSLDVTQVRKQDAVRIISQIARNPVGRGLAWDFVRQNWAIIRERYESGTFFLTDLIKSLTSAFNTEFDLQQLKVFAHDNQDLLSAKAAFNQAQENVETNVQWLQKMEGVLADWLADMVGALQLSIEVFGPRFDYWKGLDAYVSFSSTSTMEQEMDLDTYEEEFLMAAYSGSGLVTDVRLPLNVYPIHYDLELKPDVYSPDPAALTFEGQVKILVNCTRPTKTVTLHVNKLEIPPVTFISKMDDCASPVITDQSEDTGRQFLVLTFTSELVPRCMYSLETTFKGPLKDDLHGLYLSSYKKGNDTIYMATTQFQSTDARKAFPCFDEPAIKATFSVTLLRKPSMISLSNMLINRTEARSEGYVADVYGTTPKMSTSLLAFVVCDFVHQQNYTKGGTLYRVWARADAIDQADYALEVGVRILDYFEEYFDVPYPLPKQDMIAIPDFAAGAMENWGLIMYRESAMLYDPLVSAESNKQKVAVIVSHELAHQWFGNLVTPAWWDDLWLNEGFASYVEYMGVHHVHPGWKMYEQFVTRDLQDVFDFDSLTSSHPVYVPVNHPDQINEIFDRISYSKGASIIRMMRFFLGDDTFRQGLTKYLRRLAYGDAFHDDLWQALTEQSTEGAAGGTSDAWDVKAIMDTWTLQMNYPVVTLNRTGQPAGSVRVTQDRFLWDDTAPEDPRYPSPFGYRWHIPLTLVGSQSPDFSTRVIYRINATEDEKIISDSVIPLSSANSWIIGNARQYGYYRVNYDSDNWRSLISQLNDEHTVIDPINRAQIINDAWNLAKAGLLDVTTGLDTVGYLSEEESYVPWVAATRQLSNVDLMLSKSSSYGAFSSFMKQLTASAYSRLSWQVTGDHLDAYVRGTVFKAACSYGVDQCVNNATILYSTWMNDPSNHPVAADLKSFVYCTAIREGGEAEWRFAYSQYKLSGVASERSRLLSALGCASDVWILNRYLQLALNPEEIRKQDTVSAITAVARNSVGRLLVWDFYVSHWNVLFERYGADSFSFSRLASVISESFNTEAELQKLQNFIANHPNQGTGERALKQAVEKTRSNIDWMARNLDVITNWLNSRGYI